MARPAEIARFARLVWLLFPLFVASACREAEPLAACADEAAALGPAAHDKWTAYDAGTAYRACLSAHVLGEGAPRQLDAAAAAALWRSALLCPVAGADSAQAPCWRERCGALIPSIDAASSPGRVDLRIGTPPGDDPAPVDPCLEEAHLTEVGPSARAAGAPAVPLSHSPPSRTPDTLT